MADFIVAWSPETQNSVGQVVQYKLPSSGTWIDFAIVSPSTSTYLVTGLLDNTIYQFRISCECATGDVTYSQVFTSIRFTCPVVTISASTTILNYSFPTVASSITGYTVILYKDGLEEVTMSYNSPVPPTISGSFNIVAGHIYTIRVQMKAGSIVKDCPISNDIIISCTPVVGLGVTTSL